jgi:hypothetical protein
MAQGTHDRPRVEQRGAPAQPGPGMQVIGLEGSNVGRVKKMGENHFILDRPKAPDIFVPMDAVLEVRNGSQVVLRIPSTLVHLQGWHTSRGSIW